MDKVIVRLKGGVGNQLFCYAAARRLALVNNAELVIDDVSGFVRDKNFNRRYSLDHFSIPVRKATPWERLEPFEPYRRFALRWFSRRRPFAERKYLEQEGVGASFEKRLLTLKVKGSLYLDGGWLSEGYFKDVAPVIREDLRIIPPQDAKNAEMAEMIRNLNSVALHVRWFNPSGELAVENLSIDYYRRAIALVKEKTDSPHFFLFSDDPRSAQKKLALSDGRVTVVAHNSGDENAYADLWLMAQCKHFITANSTFSWWGAWLGEGKGKMVVCPGDIIEGIGWWGFDGLIPERWIKI